MYGSNLAYVALVVDDVEAEAARLEKDFGLPRLDNRIDGRSVPVMGVGQSALALFAIGDPYTGGVTKPGVHHIALGVDDPRNAVGTLETTGLKTQTGESEPSLGEGTRFLLSLHQTNGIRTYLADKIEHPKPRDGFIQRIDHLGIVGTDNGLAVETWCKALGCELTGEQFDTELQTATEHFIYKTRSGTHTVVHTRPTEFVAAVHDLFITTGDCELEIIQPLNTHSVHRATGDQAGNTKQDHGALARFLDKNGPGLHHVAFKVTELNRHLTVLADKGYRLIDSRGRPGARGSHIGFIHPKSTHGVLMHYVERPDDLNLLNVQP